MKVLKDLTPLECFYHWEMHAANEVFLRQPKNGNWLEYRWSDVALRVRKICSFIQTFSLKPQSKICVFSSNSADWFVVDLAIMLSGHINVPLYPGQDIDSASYILEHADCQLIFLGAVDQLTAVAAGGLQKKIPTVSMLGCTIDCDYSLENILESYQAYLPSPVPNPDDTMTILYTSGTTGRPKGVMHAHGTPQKVAPRFIEAFRLDEIEERPRFFSFLPLSHVAERCAVQMLSLYFNPTVSFSEGLATFSAEIQSVRPHFFFAVPRLWAKFKAAIDAGFGTDSTKFTSQQKEQIRQALGLDEAKVIITGSAPTSKELHDWFASVGIQLREGWGMTENFIDGLFFWEDKAPIAGCLGKPLPGSEVKIDQQSGELLCRYYGGMMQGYYLDAEKTAEVMTEDGWHRTGDQARIDEQGYVWITGRISESFKTSKGKYIQPVELENKLAGFSVFNQLCVCGAGLDQPVLLANLSEVSKQKTAQELHQYIEQQLQALNALLPAYERIAHIIITEQEWTIANGLLTPTLKLKRSAIEQYFETEVKDAVSSKVLITA